MASTRTSRLGQAPGSGCKEPCIVASTSNLTLSGEQVVAGVFVNSGSRVLVPAQTDASENGIYIASTGAWERSADWNQNDDVVSSTIIPVSNNISATGLIYQVQFSGSNNIGTTQYKFVRVGFDILSTEDWGLITESVTSFDDYGSL